ncbi:4Fe-4S binding protein [Clostridium sp.]|uniref:4Fe-4S binding protein n=1 Tax=Clostridium sp. TaxID=1506 RepID=UPI00261AA45C|nr:4Fe-4S binding protein [Clostridium sp.]
MDKKSTKLIVKKKAFVDISLCVACGSCTKVCPINAITINKGIHANVDLNKCIGCSKCAKECPASIIEIVDLMG